MNKAEVAEKLKRARAASGMTQKELAEKIGRSPKLIGHWETGYSQPDADTISTLLQIYGLDANDFFDVHNDGLQITTADETRLIRAYRALPEQDRRALVRFAEYADKATNPQHAQSLEEEALAASMYIEQISRSQSEIREVDSK